MSGDMAALIMGLAAVVVFIGYQIQRKVRRKKEKELLLAEFVPKEGHTDE